MKVAAGKPGAWHLVTCEYPPQVGGVSDYTATLAALLADESPTHVWCPPTSAAACDSPANVVIHRTLGSFSRADLDVTGEQLDRLPAPRRLFVQWVPHGYGYRSVNLAMALWLRARVRRHHDEMHVMVHEPYSPLSLHPARLAAAIMHRAMLMVVCASATKVWLSTPSWEPVVRPYLFGRTAAWLPIPSAPIGIVPERRNAASGPTAPCVGHFGTYSPLVTDLLEPALREVLDQSVALVRLIGRGSEGFQQSFLTRHPSYAGRMQATGVVAPSDIGRELAACDVMLQPFPDGVSARRTSVLALLRAGLPVVTNGGQLCEPFWAQEQAVDLVPSPEGVALGRATVRVLADSDRQAQLSSRARTMYDRYFDVSHAVRVLTGGSAHTPWADAMVQ